MKLIKCYISAFGKLKDFVFDFSDGVNTLFYENGWGKSTLADFIKAVFYGINSKKRSIGDNDRIKFAPWNSTERFGGYVVFEKDGYIIKAERYFGKKESEDTLTLTDVKTGKLFACPENLGEHIFKIDEEGFSSTTYFSQKDLEVKSNSSLTAKFNSGDNKDTKAFDNAVEKIEKKIKGYANSVNRGVIPDLKSKLYKLNDSIEQSKLADSTADKLRAQVDRLKIDLSDTQNKLLVANDNLQKASESALVSEKKKRLDALLEKKQAVSLAVQESEAVLNGNRLTEEETEKYFNCIKDLASAKQKQAVLGEAVKELSAESSHTEKKSFGALLCTVLSVIGLIAGIVVAFYNVEVGCVIAFVSVVALIIGVIMLVRKRKTESKNQKTDFIQKKSVEFNELTQIVNKYEEVLDAFFSRFNVTQGDYFNKIQTLKDNAYSLEKSLSELKEINKEIEVLQSQNLTSSSCEYSVDELKIKIRDLQGVFNEQNAELSKLNASLLRYEELSFSLTDLVEEKTQVQDEIEQAVKENELFKKTLKFLKEADDNLKTRYREPLSNALNRYVEIISDTQKTVNVDIDLNITVNEKAGAKKPEYYSKGWQNLFEICKRFALIDVLYPDDKPFIILDDPFYNLDESKLNSSLSLIKDLAKNHQIIYLTCHKSRTLNNA